MDLRDSVVFEEAVDGDVEARREEREVCIVERRLDWAEVGLAPRWTWLRDVEELNDELRDCKGEVCVAMSRWKSSVGSESIDSLSSS